MKMLVFLETMDILAILIMLFMLVLVLRQQSSKAQTAFIVYNLFTIIFVVGIHLELLHSETVGEALAGLCVQYVGQAGLLMSLLWFVSEFARFSVPAWVYRLEAVCNAIVLVGIFSAEKHRLFYTSMEILNDGLYQRIKVGHGILWYLHFLHLDLVTFSILIFCAVRYKESTPVQRRRILDIATGIGILAAVLFLKRIGVFGSYNPIVVALTFCMFGMMMAMVRHSYFNSLHAAVDNAFNHGNEGLIILDDEDTIVFVNHRMDELFPDIRKGASIESCQEIKDLMEGETRLLRRDGTVYELREEDIIEHGEKNGRMLWFVDQTQPLLTMKKLREADEAKTQFLMKVSHELRTPMNTMLGMNEMILRESGEEEIKNYAREVAGAGAHMMSLIDEVLDASRLESGTLTIVKNPYQIGRVLERAEEVMRPQAQEKGLVFTVETEDGLTAEDSFQIGDAARILQILVNLLSNAVKYTDKGFVSLKAYTMEEAGVRRLIMSVRDSGIGIEREEIPKIFENFGRGSNTAGRDGMGLGLAIVKQLIEAMGGTLTVESEPGKGSIFVVSLVWTEAAEEELAIWKKKWGDGETETGEEEKKVSDFHTKTILAVDDNDYNLRVLKYLLRRTRAAVETAADGYAAVEACRLKRYDLILLDHMMPGMDGIATLHAIRESVDGKNQDTKAIALTANAGKGAEEMYLSEGFAGYVAKPVDAERFEQILDRCLADERETEIAEAECIPERTGAENEKPDQTECLEQLEKYGIHVQEGLRYADMDPAFYRELLVLFAGQREKQKRKLDGIFQDIRKQKSAPVPEDERELFRLPFPWNEWIAACHGLKGEARGLGASDLGEYFYQLELAGRSGDREKIEEIYPLAGKEWKKAADGITLTMKEPFS